MYNKIANATSIIKQLPKENIYNNIKGPIDLIKKKDDSNKDLNTQIDNFQKEPNTNFLSSLQSRVPNRNSALHIQKPVDYGLSKDLIHTGKFPIESSGVTSSLLNARIPSNGKFKQSSGVPLLDKYFSKLAPTNMDYRYTDPQIYEYKLKGMTRDKLIRNKMREEGATTGTFKEIDRNLPDEEKMEQLIKQRKALKAMEGTLDPTTQYKRWREEALGNKVEKIQKAFRGYNTRENLKEGTKVASLGNELGAFGAFESKDDDFPEEPKHTAKEYITIGKAARKDKTSDYKEEQRRKQLIKQETLDEQFALENANEINANRIKAEKMAKKSAKEKHDAKYTQQQQVYHKLLKSENEEIRQDALKKATQKYGNTIANAFAKNIKQKRLNQRKEDQRTLPTVTADERQHIDFIKDLKNMTDEQKEDYENFQKGRKRNAKEKIERMKSEKNNDGEELLVREAPTQLRSSPIRLRSRAKTITPSEVNSTFNKLNKPVATVEESSEPDFVDEEAPKEILITDDEKRSFAKKTKKLDSFIDTATNSRSSAIEALKLIETSGPEGKEMSTSKSKAPAELKAKLKSMGFVFNGNAQLKTIYGQINASIQKAEREIEDANKEKKQIASKIVTGRSKAKASKESGGGGGRIIKAKI